jgi:hypothetical protein
MQVLYEPLISSTDDTAQCTLTNHFYSLNCWRPQILQGSKSKCENIVQKGKKKKENFNLDRTVLADLDSP